MHRLWERLRQGYRTIDFPKGPSELSHRFSGRPVVDPSRCQAGCHRCVDACPTAAIETDPLSLDLGACLFCPACAEACDDGAITSTNDFRLAARTRGDLVLSGSEMKLAAALERKMRKIFGRSLKLRQVSAGGCNACEADLNVTGIVVFDIGRFGIQFVASPRHADGIVVTGPVTTNMALALRETYAAVPTQTGDCRRRLRHQRRPFCRLIHLCQRHPRRHSGGSLPSWLSAPPAQHSRRPAPSAGPYRIVVDMPLSARFVLDTRARKSGAVAKW